MNRPLFVRHRLVRTDAVFINVGRGPYAEGMTKFDVSQQQVLDLDATQHARVLGAPGSGKTMLLIEAFARVSETPSWVEGDVLVLAANRLVAASLRRSLELRLQRPLKI